MPGTCSAATYSNKSCLRELLSDRCSKASTVQPKAMCSPLAVTHFAVMPLSTKHSKSRNARSQGLVTTLSTTALNGPCRDGVTRGDVCTLFLIILTHTKGAGASKGAEEHNKGTAKKHWLFMGCNSGRNSMLSDIQPRSIPCKTYHSRLLLRMAGECTHCQGASHTCCRQ